MNYLEYTFQIADSAHSEILIAFLSDFPFDTFSEEENQVKAYMKEADRTVDMHADIIERTANFYTDVAINVIPPKNWNAEWESQFKPILIDNFVAIRADFHEHFPNHRHEITINPKMAFGTGHHETTFMMMQLMDGLSWGSSKVLDYGCGTGILAVLASQLGAVHINAVDIEQPSYENTIENCEINQIHNVTTFHGTLDDIKDGDYDIILANINRNVILQSLNSLFEKLKSGGTILFSGILDQDQALMEKSITDAGFTIQMIKERGYWLAIQVIK